MGTRERAGKKAMALLVLGPVLCLSTLLSGCMSQTVEPSSEANFTPRDKKLLANPVSYTHLTLPTILRV